MRGRGRRGRGRGIEGREQERVGKVLPKLIEFEKPPKKGFREIPIIPTREEILGERPTDLPINKVDEPFESIEEYLETHYKLLREDFVRSLREGIERYCETDEHDEDARTDIRVYENVKVVGVTFAGVGVVQRISFRTQHYEQVKWSMSKRLIPGTLVVLTNDKFSTMKFATVINRPEELLSKSYNLQIDIMFRPEDIEFELPDNYIMVESISSYFEAYRYILNVLQELDPDTLPFKSHIIGVNPNIGAPKYQERRVLNQNYDFGNAKAFKNMKEVLGQCIKLLGGMAEYLALKRMLTRELALIQGPPGTGKTYVGLAAVQILLENTAETIIIACQTNHALDQFLEGILDFEENIIRLGSRSKSERVLQHTLYEKSRNAGESNHPELSRLYKERAKIERKMEKLCDKILDPFVDMEYIREKEILSEDQISSLKQDDWYLGSSQNERGEQDRNYIKEWLESSIMTYSSTYDELENKIAQTIAGEQKHDEEDEVEDEEMIEDAKDQFQGIEGGIITKGKYVKVKGDIYVNSETYVNNKELSDYESVEDLWEIPPQVRAALHNKWRKRRLDEIKKQLKLLNQDYSKISEEIKTQKIRKDLVLLKSARVIGMTTTAAAKYHVLLMNLEPKIMVIEEAAETLEAHIITALTPSIEHLILIGDHKQLRPNTSVHELADYNNLGISLFERLVKYLPFTQLTEQRRMRPEIRELLTPIYNDTLTDHEKEEETLQESMSKINKFEARMCAKLAAFLVNCEYDPTKIMYSGQRKMIESLLREEGRKSEDVKKL
ncbi:11399_t:CDS:10 [Acaulospora colombiana]|uniref:11399_t:CDS:1 n=1 Tax=Acaulospora colombiana TaxID=27376 RepID=A0ACA9KVX3_9GLOM|nr:11399_t:CDS:10 [Acaulospora colombiana]